MEKILGLNTDWGRPGCDGKYGGVGWYRIINPLEKIGATVKRSGYLLEGPKTALELKKLGDIWVTKPMDSMDVLIELFTDRDITDCKLVLDLDDDPFNLNKEHPSYQSFIDRKPQYEYVIKNANHIIVSNENIAKVIKHLNNKITVIPNGIDENIWKVKRKNRKDGIIKIGWFGSASHMVDLPIILPAIEALEEKYPNVEFHLAGMVLDEIQEGRRFHHPPTKGYEEYPQWLADMDLDIAIAPLLNTKFNRAKSNIKWLEHAMLDTPMVLSKVTPYKECVTHGKDGFLAETTEDWIKYLSMLIEDKELREKIGKEAHKTTIKDWNIKKFLPLYKKLFKKLEKKEVTVYTSVLNGYDRLIEHNLEGADFVAYADINNEFWDCKKPYTKFKDDRRNSRIQKIMPHLYLDTQYSIYLDGNVELLVPPQKIIDEFLKDKDIAVFRHIGRDCVYDEAAACIGLKRGTPGDILGQMSAYAKKNYPKHNGLAECGMIARRHTKRINDLNEKWWAHYCRYSERDQLSFPVVFPKEEVNFIESSVWRHPYFSFKQHSQ